MTYVDPTYVSKGKSEDPRGDASDRGDDPFYMEYGEGGRKIDVSGMSYGHPDDGKAVEAHIGKAGDGGPESFG